MDHIKYRLLLDLAETKNFTRTAERMGYSQPGVSHIIRTMEKEMGFPLVIREKYGIMLTQAANLLLPKMQEVLKAEEKLEQTIYAIGGLEYGTVSIGTYSSIAIHLLPPVLRKFRERYPGIKIVLREGGADQILVWMDQGIIDFALMSRPQPCTMDFFPLGQDALVAVLPLDTEEEEDDSGGYDIRKFDGREFIISAAGNDFDVHRALDSSGVKPKFNYSVLDDHSILSMVENHLGVSILSRLIVRGYEDRVRLLELRPLCQRLLGIAMKDYGTLSPAARNFVEFAQGEMKI